MIGQAFLNAVANGRVDVIQILLDLVEATGAAYCVIGGLAVNAYAEPVVSLDLDLVIAADRIDNLCQAARSRGFKVEEFGYTVNMAIAGSDLRIQLQTDPRYQAFLAGATRRTVLGYELSVAAVEDVLRSKIWAWSDDQRRRSKRQKDLADIMRLVETHPALRDGLPPELRSEME